MRPCRVCGNKNPKKLSRHHLIEKQFRSRGRAQITVKLCRDGEGCQVHRNFHLGDPRAARIIREHLKKREVIWMIKIMGEEWVDTIYPLVYNIKDD